MIKLSQEIPEVFDVSNQDAMKNWMIAVKQCVDELARKAASIQTELRTGIPSSTDLEEAEFVRDATHVYHKINGTVKTIATT